MEAPPPPPSDDLPPPPPPTDLPPPPPPSERAPPPPPPDTNGFEPDIAPRRVPKKPAPKKNPPSIEQLLRKKQEAADAAAKPVFLSKKQREQLALEARRKEAEERKKREQASQAIFARAAESKKSEDSTRGLKTSQNETKDTETNNAYDEAVQELVRERYLGPIQKSTFSALKKRKRTTDKKFSFDWSAEDDTYSNEYDPLYKYQTQPASRDRAGAGGMDDGQDRAQRRDLEMRNWSEKPLNEMTARDWRLARSEYNISVKGGSLPNPARNWKETGLPDNILDTVVNKIGYTEPSAIQRMAIPISLQGRDVIGIAETGSGKTAAFALPLLTYIETLPPIEPNNPGPYAIILAPTRELAQQIEAETTKLATGTGYKVVSLTGGHSIEEQAFHLRDGAEIIVATPGRLVDVIERRLIVLNQCCYIVMDEADRMVDMGFQDPLEKILGALPVTNQKPDTDDAEDSRAMTRAISDVNSRGMTRYRQTHLYSATLSPPIQRLARQYTRRPAEIQIGEANTGVETVVQQVEFVSGEDRRKRRLADILGQRAAFPPPIIVFVNVRKACDSLARDIRHMGHSATTLSGSKTQEQREAALASLRRGDVEVLVATDLAGRGIDVPDVSLVVNFTLPDAIEKYLHRIGRTGRAGKSGTAISFISNDDSDIMYELKGVLSRSSISKVPEDLRKHPAAQQKGGKGQKFDDGGGKGGFK